MAHIEKRGSKRYRARYRTPAGEERSRTFSRKVDAERFLASVEVEKAQGRWVDPRLGKTLFADWAERWFATTVHLKPATRASYRSLLDVHILKRFGTTPLHAIRHLDIREWVAQLETGGLSASRIRQARQVLSSTLRAAVESGYLVANPALGVKTPRERPKEMRFLTAEQVEDLAAAVSKPIDTLVYVLAYGGLRWGEAAALRRKRLDILGRRLHVTESLAEVNGNLHFGDTKTNQSRTVSLPRFLATRLGRHLGTHVGPDPDSLVFTSPQGDPIRYSHFRPRIWLPALSATESVPDDLRIHELRHTAATLLIAQGAHPKAIQQHLGHSSITVTLDRYGHLFPGELDRLADRLDAIRAAVLDQSAASPRPEGQQRVLPFEL